MRAVSICSLDYYTDDRLTIVTDTLKRIMTNDNDFDCRNLARQALGMQFDDIVFYANSSTTNAIDDDTTALSINVDVIVPTTMTTVGSVVIDMNDHDDTTEFDNHC